MKQFLLSIILIVATGRFSYAQTPSILWHFNTHDASFGNAALGDLDHDGRPEIAFSSYWGDSCIYVLNAEDGTLLWKKNMNGCNDAAPIIFDVDNDSLPEVILASSCNPVLTCFNGIDGAIKWQTPFGGTDSPPSIADIDGDNQMEILVGDFEGRLNCYRALNGTLKWQITVDANAAIEASPALVDVNNDTHPDIIVNTWAYGGSGDSTAVYAYDGMTQSLLWKNPIPTDVIYHGAAFADVDEDGKPELAITSYDGNVYLLNGENGSVAWQYPTPGLTYIGDPVTIGDLDNDNHLDLVFIGGYGEVDALDRFGGLKWNFMLPLYQSSFRGASLADVNNDDTLDVVFAASNGVLYALNGSRGNLLWNINLRTDYGDSSYSLEHGPVISNFRNDDTLDVFVAGGYANYPNIQTDFGRAYAIKIGKSPGPAWTMFQHDYTRSNCICTPTPTGIISQEMNSLNISDAPNPFTEKIVFNISLDKNTTVNAAVFDMQGVAVKTFSDETLATGNYQYIWQGKDDGGNNLPAGIYFFRITAGNFSSVKKVVLMR
ncbi:MAG: FG-GAP-like repeat-containing protein [Bacteroidetes bacterium]|jgi:outer membrane protein assembly factor BamB|nr:FG-GAP-like repeat-containing protein [Bacteroidota bacterium]